MVSRFQRFALVSVDMFHVTDFKGLVIEKEEVRSFFERYTWNWPNINFQCLLRKKVRSAVSGVLKIRSIDKSVCIFFSGM